MSTNARALVIPPTNAPSGTNDIRDIRGPVAIPTGWLWLVVVLLAGATAWAAFFLIRRLRRRHAPPMPVPLPPHVRARHKLSAALDQIHDPERFCVLVSGTLRVYLEERFELRAPERTTEEFLEELKVSPLLNADQKLGLGVFLQRCDLVKFARQQLAQTELRGLWDSAMRLVEETSPSAMAPAGDGVATAETHSTPPTPPALPSSAPVP